MPTLRVGYINLRGLGGDKGDPVMRLLHSKFEFLFLAET